MAAYTSLLSLGHSLEQILQHPPYQMAVLDETQIDALLKNITFLQDFLENFSLIRGDEIQALEEKIARSAFSAEAIIEMRVVGQILQNSEAGRRTSGIFSHVNTFLKKMNLPNVLRSSTLFSRDLQRVIKKIGSMKKDVMKIKETERRKINEHPRKVAAGSSVRGVSDSKNVMVGFDEDLIQIMEKLTGHQSNLRIISIVGMGGIGKTTLARNVYHNPYIVHHFHVHAWATISQQYSVHKILLALLKDIRVLTEYRTEEGGRVVAQQSNNELGEQLYKNLSGRKYFIVLDDLWSSEFWNDAKRFFPENNNGSRVMITTRLTNVADDFRSCTPHQLHFLDDDQSWALFCDKAFGKESCPPELEEVGKTIVRNCGALPLAIVATSGLLAKSSRTAEYWKYVANDSHAALNMGGERLCSEILSLSYEHLPVHLKPCFLYMAIYPEDCKIKISKLIKLWVAEGILKPIPSRSLEEVAEDNLKDLIDRNLIQVHDYGSRNKIKTCTIHDLLRELCLKEAQKEKFHDTLDDRRRIITKKRQLIGMPSSDEEELKSTFAKLNYNCSYAKYFQLALPRCIDFKARSFLKLLNSLESLSLLRNLQTVIITGTSRFIIPGTSSETPINLPAEIWEMPQLRHLKREGGEFYLTDPPSTNNKNGRRDVFVLKNLQTLYKMRNFRCTDEVVDRIPGLTKLGITYREFPSGFGWDYYKVYNLARLHNLESLVLRSDENVLQNNICFPRSLKKLTLERCRACWEDLTVIGALPHLEVLNLMDFAVCGREWNPVEGQFLELKSLRIVKAYIEEWIAESYHFPRLEKLVLWGLSLLKAIPNGVGEIQTLISISCVGCNDSLISSAKKIEEEQQNLGNYDLQVQVQDRFGMSEPYRKFWT